MSRIDAVIFDWGGTLSVHVDLDLHDVWSPSANGLAPLQGEALTQLLFDAEERAWARGYDDQASTRLADLFREALAELDLEVDESAVAAAMEQYFATWSVRVVHEPDALPVLAALSRAGLRTGLLSNTHWPREYHERLLARDGLSEFLDVRRYTSELVYTKPHREAFLAVLEELAVEPTRAVFVGDRPYDDIFGAKAMGMWTVLKPNRLVPSHDVEPDAVISSLSELPALIDGWRR